jgi:hypothetical protein
LSGEATSVPPPLIGCSVFFVMSKSFGVLATTQHRLDAGVKIGTSL